MMAKQQPWRRALRALSDTAWPHAFASPRSDWPPACSPARPPRKDQGTTAPAGDGLRTNEALLMLDYQVIKVPGDAPIDLMGFHLHSKVRDGLYLGAGVYAPHVKGEYGGFMAFDVGVHLQHRLGGPWFATADLSGGGGGGGRSVAESKVLSGTGGFVKASVGLAYDLGPFALGVSATRMKFRQSLIDSTQANVFVTIPYTYLTGAFGRHGEALSAAEDRRAAAEMGENMLTVTLDNFRQIDPQGSNKGTVRTADLQFAHFFSPDAYWFGALGRGLQRPAHLQPDAGRHRSPGAPDAGSEPVRAGGRGLRRLRARAHRHRARACWSTRRSRSSTR